MKLEINNDIAKTIDLDEKQMLEVFAIALYKLEKINGVQGGKLLGISEIEFHGILGKYGQFVNYNEEDLETDLNNLKDF